ncbi:MAG: hypothetical protein WAU07_02245 [Microgenomates group bacterium]
MILVITGFSILVIVSLLRTANRGDEITQAIAVIEQDLQLNREKNQTLAEEVLVSESDFSQEKIVRNELLKKLPGEYVVHLPEPSTKQPKLTAEEPQTPIQAWMELLL